MVSYHDRLLWKRRRRALYFLLLGLDLGEVCRRTAEDFECSTRTIRRDLAVIGEWLPSLLHEETTGMSAYMTVHIDLSELEAILFRIADSGNDYASLSAVKVVLNIIKKRMKLLEDIGFFEELRRIREFEARMEVSRSIHRVF